MRTPNADPDSFDITVDRGGARVVTLSPGIHYVGANLAGAEMRQWLAFLAERGAFDFDGRRARVRYAVCDLGL